MNGSRRQKQIRLTVFDNEPEARLAATRLREEDIACAVRSLGAGPGLGVGIFNVPHALYVYEEDVVRACDVLDLPPAEVLERQQSANRPISTTLVILLIITAGALLFGIIELLVNRILR